MLSACLSTWIPPYITTYIEARLIRMCPLPQEMIPQEAIGSSPVVHSSIPAVHSSPPNLTPLPLATLLSAPVLY